MPANTMVYNVAGYSFKDYVKAGVPLIVVSAIVSLVLLPILFPHLTHNYIKVSHTKPSP